MKKLIKVLSIVILGVMGLSLFASAGSPSYNYKREFQDTIKNLLGLKNFSQLQEYVNSIPDCYIQENDKSQQPLCTMDRIDGNDFVAHALFGNRYNSEYKNFNVINVDFEIADALESLYMNKYNSQNARKLNVKQYNDFYKIFRNTWLQEDIEHLLMKVWQKGENSFMDRYSNFEMMTGKTIFNTLYLSKELKFDNIYKYVSPEIFMTPYEQDPIFKNHINFQKLNNRRNKLHTILNEMKRGAEEKKSKNLLSEVVGHWFDSIIFPEQWGDEAEKEYYKGTKQKQMYLLLNEEGWKMFGENGLVSNDNQKHIITLNVKACRRVLNNKSDSYESKIMDKEKICSAFEKGAEKYGFYISPEKIAEQQEKELTEAINKKSNQLQKGFYNPAF